MPSTKPPMSWRIFGKLIPQKLLGCFSSDSGILRMLGDNIPGTIAKKKDIAATHLPEIKSGVVNCRGILRRHERFQTWQIGQQLCRPRQCNLSKLLRILEREDRIDEIRRELTPYLSLHAVT